MGVSEWMFLLLPAHPGSPDKGLLNGGVCVCVCVKLLWSTLYAVCVCCFAEETIDLTATGDSDIDRAVAESLRDVQGGGIFGGQVTQEEEQISKFVLCFVFSNLHHISGSTRSVIVFPGCEAVGS